MKSDSTFTRFDSPAQNLAALEGGADAAYACVRKLRGVPLDKQHPTLTSGYHKAGNITTKFLCDTSAVNSAVPLRQLTVRECARVMGFPDEFVIPGEKSTNNEKRTRFYKQIGNAVCPPVIEAVTRGILRTKAFEAA